MTLTHSPIEVCSAASFSSRRRTSTSALTSDGFGKLWCSVSWPDAVEYEVTLEMRLARKHKAAQSKTGIEVEKIDLKRTILESEPYRQSCKSEETREV